MSIESGLGVRASDLKDEQLVNVKKVRKMEPVLTVSDTLLTFSLQALYAASILALAILSTAKASVALLLVAIQPPKPVVIGSYVFVGAILAWCFGGSIAIAFQCHPPSTAFFGTSSDEICLDRYTLQLSLGVMDILADVAVVVLAYFTMRGVQITVRRRTSIVALFGLRLLYAKHTFEHSFSFMLISLIRTPACTIGALVVYEKYWHQRPRDTARDIVVPLLWSQGALHASIITACIPSIKRFFMSAQSGLMGVQITEQYELTHASKKDTPSTALSQNESRSEPRVEKGKISNIKQTAGHDAQYQGPGVCTGSEEVHSRTRVRGGMPSEQAEETESMRGLTSDVNHEKHEFTLDFADGESRHSSLN
jgi:hypothetical protein